MRRSFGLFAASCLLTLAATAQSRADQLFWYNWSRTPFSIPFVQKNNPSLAGTGGVNLIDLNSKAVEGDATLSTGNPAADIQIISTTDSTNPDIIASGGGKYTLTLQIWLKDPNLSANAGQPVGTATFNGMLGNLDYTSGPNKGQPIGNTSLASNISNTILSSTDSTGTHLGQNFATVTVGGSTFTVNYTGFAEPGDSQDGGFGAISFHIGGSSGGGTDGGKSPEPSGMVLGCLGLTVLGGVVWRARRRKLVALKAMA